ncbi:MAG: hypothetical protein JHD33_04880 [Chthoniobacterales bacterium]|nr:hypothetical protein [Chthoniobacterales bacterium]
MPRRAPPCAPLMQNISRALLAGFLAFALQASPRAADETQAIEVLTVPSPAEFFAALDRIVKPDWASFYREPIPTNYPGRPLAAVNLGTLVTDGYVAVEAQDGQQVKNTGKDIITLARALGVGEHVLARGKSISDFADRNDWAALKEELDATTNEVRLGMAAQRDEGLATLITAGAWLRALEVGSRAAELSGEAEADEILSQSALLAYLREDLEKLPEKSRNESAVEGVRAALSLLEERMKKDTAEGDGPARPARIGKIAADYVAAAATRQK